MVLSPTLTTHPCPRCQAPVVDPGSDSAGLLRCTKCGHELLRAVLAAADPALSESLSAGATVFPARPGPAATLPSNPASGDEPPFSPEFLANFQILATLGAGAMGVVYLARQLRLERLVAIKTIKGGRIAGRVPTLPASSQSSARFSREGVALARLSHPNVLAIHEAGEDQGVQYISFEYVEGTNLKQLLMAEGALPVARCLELADLLLAGLDHAHCRGVVHRDLKPENILLPASGGLKIADFGLARLAGSSTEKLTATGMVMGTPCYMSPEQVQGARATISSDIYSVGIVVYEMLAGTVPYTAPSVPELLIKHVRAPVPDVRAARADLPPGLVAATQKALQKEPAQRWESAAAFREALRLVASGA